MVAMDIWNGYIYEMDDKEIICILRRDYNCDKELIVPKELLTKEQNDMVSIGLCLRFDLVSEKLEFMLKDGVSWI